MAMGRIETFDIALKGREGAARLSVALLDGERKLTAPEIARWIEASAARDGTYFGGFTVQRSLIVLEPVPGQRYLRRGMVAGGGGATMMLRFLRCRMHWTKRFWRPATRTTTTPAM